ncbi:MAG: hypothetical protein ACT4OS_04705 [Acidimicrobiales bacterium]
MRSSLSAFHNGWAWMMIVGNGLAGLWSLGALRLEVLRRKALWWFTVAVQVAVFVQVIGGVWMVAAQDRPVNQFHMFYGFVAIITTGLLYSSRQSARVRTHLLYGLGGLFLMGLGIRAILVGS